MNTRIEKVHYKIVDIWYDSHLFKILDNWGNVTWKHNYHICHPSGGDVDQDLTFTLGGTLWNKTSDHLENSTKCMAMT